MQLGFIKLAIQTKFRGSPANKLVTNIPLFIDEKYTGSYINSRSPIFTAAAKQVNLRSIKFCSRCQYLFALRAWGSIVWATISVMN